MEKQDLFDRYLFGELNETECTDFEKKLEEDIDFAESFHIYLAIVKGLRKEAEQDGIEFGNAMKNMTESELREMLERKKTPTNRKTVKISFWKPLIAIAACLVFAVVLWNNHRNSQYAMDDLIYAYNEPIFRNRGGEDIGITDLKIDDLDGKLPRLEEFYQNAETLQDSIQNGKGLAVVYIKLHKREKAKKILQELIDKIPAEENDWDDAKAELKKILKQIQ